MIENKRISKFRTYLKVGVNISLIVVSLFLFTLLIKSYFFSASNETIKSIAVGDQVIIPDLEWEKGKTHILLFLHTSCQYCTKSADFYKKLLEEINGKSNIKLVAVFSQSDSGESEYLKDIGLGNIEKHTISFAKVGITGTPTLAIVNDRGVLSDIWKGYLSPNKENEVRQKLELPIKEELYIEESKITDLKKKGQNITIVDVRSRNAYQQNHFTGAKNIPLDELSVRAINELSPSETIVVYGLLEDDGENAQIILRKEGFSKVYILRIETNLLLQ